MPEKNDFGSKSREQLTHSQGEIVVGTTTSPKGKDCVGMTYKGEIWLLFGNYLGPRAMSAIEDLQNHFGFESLLGPAIDWQTSIESGQIDLLDDPSQPPANGLYVKPEAFDQLMGMSYKRTPQ